MSEETFLCPRWAAQVAACRGPLDHRYRGMLEIKRLGDEAIDGTWTNWAVTAGFTLLIFLCNAHHREAFARFGYEEQDMLITGSGQRCRSGTTHPDFLDDPKGEWELRQEVMRVLRDEPDLLTNRR